MSLVEVVLVAFTWEMGLQLAICVNLVREFCPRPPVDRHPPSSVEAYQIVACVMASPSVPVPDFSRMKKEQLKDACRQRSLSVTGNKPDLVTGPHFQSGFA